MTNRKNRESSQTHRTISDALAPIVEQLELKGDRLVVLDDLRALRPDVPDGTVRRMAGELVQRGWLHPLAVKGAYEFIPGSAAGRYQSGDPWLNLKGVLRLQTGLYLHVGLSSAAWLHGYRQRAPSRQIIVAAREPKPPPSLSKVYILVKTDRNRLFGSEQVRGLPVATIERLFVETVWRPDLMDIRTDIDWLSKLMSDVEPMVVAEYLERLSVNSAWARAGYLADLGGNSDLEETISDKRPPFEGPFYLGDSRHRDRYVSKWRLYDNIGLWKLQHGLDRNDY